MRTDASKKFALDFRAALDKENGDRPRDGNGRFGVDREGRGKAREQARLGTCETREQIRDLKNQGKPEDAKALEDHLRRMSNRLGEARARMLPDTMPLHGIRPPIPAKRTTFERPEIIVPKEDSLSKEGTSDGAKLGWETRRGGAKEPLPTPSEAETNRAKRWIDSAWSNRWDKADPKKTVAAFASDARVKMDNLKSPQELRVFADALEDENHHDLAAEARDRLLRQGYDYEGKPRAVREARKDDAPRTMRGSFLTEGEVGKEGTSEGAKLGWETRREGGSPETGKPEEKPNEPAAEPEKPGRPEYYDRGAKAEESMRQLYRAKEATAKEVHDVAAQMLDVGEKYLADTKKLVVEVEQEFTSRGKEMRGTAKKLFESAKGDLQRGDFLLEDGKKQLDALSKMDPTKKIDVYDHANSTDLPWRAAGQAHNYLAAVRSLAPKPKVKKAASEEDEDAETEGEQETARRRPLPAEARGTMPGAVKQPPRPPGPPQPKQMRVGPRKVEGPRLMPVRPPRNPTYVQIDREGDPR